MKRDALNIQLDFADGRTVDNPTANSAKASYLAALTPAIISATVLNYPRQQGVIALRICVFQIALNAVERYQDINDLRFTLRKIQLHEVFLNKQKVIRTYPYFRTRHCQLCCYMVRKANYFGKLFSVPLANIVQGVGALIGAERIHPAQHRFQFVLYALNIPKGSWQDKPELSSDYTSQVHLLRDPFPLTSPRNHNSKCERSNGSYPSNPGTPIAGTHAFPVVSFENSVHKLMERKQCPKRHDRDA
jgi:hypothetical protein